MRTTTLTIAITALMLVPTIAHAQQVTVDHDRQANFAKYRTWTFGEGTPADNPFNQARIEQAIGTQLEAKGLRPAAERPDLLVVTHVTGDEQVRLQTWDTGVGYYGWRGRLGTGMATTTVHKEQVGTLMVDLVDAETGQLIWRGTATDKVDAKPEKNEKRINKAAEKMFKKYPAVPVA